MSDHIELDDYEAVNLLSVLRASGAQDSYPDTEKLPRPNALAVMNSGDWVGQLIHKLETRLELRPGQPLSGFESKRYGLMHPNFTPQQYVEKAFRQIKIDMEEIERIHKSLVKNLIDSIGDAEDAD